MRVSTSGRVSNLIGAAFSWLDLPGSGFGRGGAFAAAGFTATGFATAGFATAGFAITGFAITGFAITGFAITGFAITGFAITGFAITGLGAGLLGFTVTFDVAGDGFVFAGGRTTFFGAAAL
jgi:hypothetical protein